MANFKLIIALAGVTIAAVVNGFPYTEEYARSGNYYHPILLFAL